jgi:hypothetical protein
MVGGTKSFWYKMFLWHSPINSSYNPIHTPNPSYRSSELKMSPSCPQKIFSQHQNIFDIGTKSRKATTPNQATDSKAPPSYSEHNILSPKELKKVKAFAASTPQWRWSNAECRAWITAVCVSYLNTTMEEAEIRAARYDGFGTNLWWMSSVRWKQLCGGNVDEESSISNLFA